ncbi:luciferase-like monooxygenase [Mycobacteroides abscessus subsp. abscessus]|nr:luciferase-like monooxygenase [Mycobacteroides abscessus subsp. abscessus]
MLAAHCADIGRDPKEITLSAHIRLGADRDYARVVDEAASLGAEGLDLAIIYLPPPYDPAVLEPLAQALRG